MSWLADASANRIVQSYINNFMDLSGNFKVRYGDSGTEYYTYSWTTYGSEIIGDASPDYIGMWHSLSEDGKTFITTAQEGDNPETGQGTFYVFRFNDSTQDWDELGNDIPGINTEYTDRGNAVKISRNGNIVAITGGGGTTNNGNAIRMVRVYEYNSGTNTWDQLGSDILSDTFTSIYEWQAHSYGEHNVALNGDGTIVAVGIPPYDSRKGVVRIYQYSGGSWNQLGADIDGDGTNTDYGTSIWLNTEGNVVSILKNTTTNPSGYTGVVFTYEYTNGSWVQRESGNGVYLNATHTYATAMNYDATRMALGSHTWSTNKGMAAVYEYNSDTRTWSQLGSNIYHPLNSSGEFAQPGRLAISGDGTVFCAGSTYGTWIYKYKNGAWSLFGSNTSLMSGSYRYMGPALNKDGTILVVANHKGNSNKGNIQAYKANATLSDSSNSSAYEVVVTESLSALDVSGGTVNILQNTMDISAGVVDISGTTWINRGQSGASIADAYQGALIIESNKTTSSDAVFHVETAGQTQAFSIRGDGSMYSDNALRHSSDDRRKINEQHITNAMETLNKLSPQIYTKLNDLVQNGGTPTNTESGLIAQEIYYNAPELRHLVTIQDENGNKLTPQEYDLSGNDIQNDPDYTALGWGNNSAYVDYIGLIPYLIKANQEKQAILDAQESTISQQTTQIDDLKTRLSSLESK